MKFWWFKTDWFNIYSWTCIKFLSVNPVIMWPSQCFWMQWWIKTTHGYSSQLSGVHVYDIGFSFLVTAVFFNTYTWQAPWKKKQTISIFEVIGNIPQYTIVGSATPQCFTSACESLVICKSRIWRALVQQHWNKYFVSCSPSSKMSIHQISLRLKAAELIVKLAVPLWNLTGA